MPRSPESFDRERRLKEIVPQNDFDLLYEWGEELLPPLKVYTHQKWFYKGISSTSEKIYINIRIREYCMAMYVEGRFSEWQLDHEVFLQNLVKKYWKRWWLWEGCINLTQQEAELRWLKEITYRRRIQDNYIENVDKMLGEFRGKWTGRNMLIDVKKKRGRPKKSTP